MRSVVVLPAPLGPRSPVISPSRATKETPSTARTAPKDLRSSCSSITAGPRSRVGSVGIDEGGRLAQFIEAVCVQAACIERADEFPQQARHAAHGQQTVALPRYLQDPPVRQRARDGLRVAW